MILASHLQLPMPGKRVDLFKRQHIVETKALLSGAVQQFLCELLHLDNTFGVLRYVIDREYYVNDIRLMPGDVTIALYWTDRPYTLYVWQMNGGKNAAYYFNIADNISLLPGEFRWRDLAVDILVDTAGAVHVLDEDELPADLPAGLRAYISAAKSQVLSCYKDVVMEADVLMKKYAVGDAKEQ